MGLPRLDYPTFKTTLHSTEQEIEFRPFLVKEEKILLMALEGRGASEMTNAVIRVLEACILTEGIDVKTLPMFEIERLFLLLRSKSVNEVISVIVSHMENSECKHRQNIEINIDDIKYNKDISDGLIQLTDTIGIKLRYPNINMASKLDSGSTEEILKMVSMCVDMIYDENEVYDDFTEDELVEWLNGLNQNQFLKITDFFNNIPKLKYDLEWTCSKCNTTEKTTLEGLHSFFT